MPSSLRFPTAVLLACGVTFFLFWTMQALVHTEGELEESKAPLSIDFVRLRRDNTPQEKKREPPKREKPDQPPPPPDMSMSKSSLDPGEGVAMLAPDINAGAALEGGLVAGGGSDRDAVPLVRIEPDYPMRARQLGIEGWVQVRFDVNKAGGVKNAVVVASHPPKVFDRAAIQAVIKWKYNPKIRNGAAEERVGLEMLFPFGMEK